MKEKIFEKALDKGGSVWYTIKAKKQGSPPSPYRQRARRVDIFSFLLMVKGRFVVRGFALRDFLFYRVTPGNWRYLLISAARDLLVNEEIHEKEVRVIADDGEALGVMSGNAALKLAYDRGLDLVLMAPQATPPVCRIMDYGKYRFDREKKEKEAKKKQQVIELKEVQLSCRIDVHDFETKARNAVRFLTAGNKVRVVVRFKGREMAHQELGRDILTRFEEAVSSVGTVEKKPVLDGRILSMVVSPVKN